MRLFKGKDIYIYDIKMLTLKQTWNVCHLGFTIESTFMILWSLRHTYRKRRIKVKANESNFDLAAKKGAIYRLPCQMVKNGSHIEDIFDMKNTRR